MPLNARALEKVGRVLRVGDDSPDRRSAVTLALVGLLAQLFYGAVMGAFGLRPVQMLYSAMKLPMLLGVTFSISLPSFFVLNTVLGLRGEFGRSMAAMLCAQTAMAVTLASLAPMTILWYFSGGNYDQAILFNGVVFAMATVASQVVLRRMYRPLIAVNPKHRWVLRAWIATFTFVAIQMAWVLRPFVGSPMQPTGFFRQGAWSNAYVFVAGLIWAVIRRLQI